MKTIRPIHLSVLLITLLSLAFHSRAAVVTTPADSGAGSLRQAVIDASPGETITFTNTLDGATILLTGGQIVLDKNLTIDASALSNGLAVSGNNSSRIFTVNSGTTNALHNLTLTAGNGIGAVVNGFGGAIYNEGNLQVSASTIHGNTAIAGGAIFSAGGSSQLTMNESTLTGNTANYGGAFLFRTSGTVILAGCTVSGNTGTGGTGGIVLESSASLTLQNTILAGNERTDNTSMSDLGGLGGTAAVAGNNFIGVQSVGYAAVMPVGNPNINGDYVGTAAVPLNPLLAPLDDFDGPTQTMVPLPGSPVIDAGDTASTNSLTDQRGLSRVYGSAVDIGAVENQAANFVWHVAINGSDSAAGLSWATAKETIQAAVDAAAAGDTVIVSNGVYATGGRAVYGAMTNRVAIDKSITVQSLNGPDVTIIEGSGPIGYSAVRCAYVGYNATLSGFTLANGATRASGDFYRERSGGGVYCEDSAIVTNCTLTGNQAAEYGGGSYGGMLNNCMLTSNSAGYGGGGSYDGTLRNCILSGNSSINGGGAYRGSLYNCTVTDNSADYGGGVYDASLYNSIVYFNTAPYSSNENHENSYWYYSCTTPNPGGTDNITNAPVFFATNDYHLASGSPGVNAGDNSYVNSSTDLDGNPRIVGGTVDMGAYESPSVIVTVNAGGGTGMGSGLYFPGESISISAQGSTAHYSFTSWNDGNTNRFRTITVPASNITYTASFIEDIADSLTAYVAVSNATPVWPYASWDTAATTIQDAVDAMGDGYGDTVIVSNGVYATGGRPAAGNSLNNRVLIEKDILVKSVNGPDVTIIEGEGPIGSSAVRCVYLHGNATLSGFSLTNGATWHRYSGGYDDDSGAGVYCESGAVVTNCTLTGNRADNYGGGSYQGNLSHCTITGNWAAEYGGGSYSGTLQNCLLTDNRARFGGGMAAATLYNCTVTGNEALSGGGGANGGSMYNSIVYFNTASYDANYDYAGFQSSCTTPMPSSGSGNTASPPMFAAADDFRLMAGSPCIAEGDNGYAYQTATDLDGNPRIVGDVVDMGAYESPYIGVRVVNADGTGTGGGNFLPGTSNVVISATSTNAHKFFSSWSDGDTSMPRTLTVSTNKITYTAIFTQYVGSVTAYVSLDSPNPVPPYRTWDTAANNMHDAIDALLDGDVVIVSNGVYAAGSRTVGGYALPNRVAVTKALTVQSLNGPDVTIIEGAGPIGPSAVRCAYVGPGATLSGFTLTNGAALATGAFFPEMSGGGAYCATGAVLTNCTLIGNSATSGGAVYSGTLNDCILTDNWAPNWGGATRDSTLNDCLLFSNDAELQGGGAFQGTLNHCILSNNLAMLDGGGAAFAELNDCTLIGNEADAGGGAYDSTLNHCILTGNSGYNNGGGAAFGTLNNCLLKGNSSFAGGGARGATLNNCTVAYNSAEFQGGGTYEGWMKNCIVYHNQANWNSDDPASDPNANHYGSTFSSSCTFPDPGIVGNISDNPQFFGENDLRLQPGSPCIDAGNNAYTNSLTDLDGFSRIVDGTVDMGAYEYQSIIIASSPPVLTDLMNLGDGTFQFGFTNLTGASFTVFGTTNLALPFNEWSNLGPVAETPPGSGQFQFTDPATNHPQRFYRVLSP